MPSAAGFEAEVVPVTCLNCQFLLSLSFCHTLLDTMVDTWSVSNDQGWSWICLSLSQIALAVWCRVSTHGDLCYIYITVGHCNACKVFLLGLFTTSSELSNRTSLGSLGSLSTCVGVNLGIEYHDVDIFAGSQNVVYAAEADIISPSVTTEDPLGLLSQIVLILNDVFAGIALAGHLMQLPACQPPRGIRQAGKREVC